MELNSSPATDPATPVVDDKPNYANANDLDFEMTAEEESAFINETLGLAEAPKVEPKEEPKADTPPEPVAPVVEPIKEEPKTEPVAPVEKEPTTPTEPDTVKTDDLWVEVDKVTTDDEGKQTVEKVKLVFDPEDPSSFIPDDFTFKSDKQLADILEAKAEMSALYKERNAELESKKADESLEKHQADQVASWEAEIDDLIGAGIIDAPKVKPGDADFLKDPTVQKIDAVFKYMTAQNELRAKDGKTAIQSFGTAFTMYSKDEAIKAEAAAKDKDNADAKRKGALVGGSSSAATGTTAPYIAGSASNIWEIPVE